MTSLESSCICVEKNEVENIQLDTRHVQGPIIPDWGGLISDQVFELRK